MESGICFIIPIPNIYEYDLKQQLEQEQQEIGWAQPVNEVSKNVNWKKNFSKLCIAMLLHTYYGY